MRNSIERRARTWLTVRLAGFVVFVSAWIYVAAAVLSPSEVGLGEAGETTRGGFALLLPGYLLVVGGILLMRWGQARLLATECEHLFDPISSPSIVDDGRASTFTTRGDIHIAGHGYANAPFGRFELGASGVRVRLFWHADLPLPRETTRVSLELGLIRQGLLLRDPQRAIRVLFNPVAVRATLERLRAAGYEIEPPTRSSSRQ